MPQLLMGEVILGDVSIVQTSATRWTGALTPAKEYFALRPKLQGNLPHTASSASDASAYMSAFTQLRAEQRLLGLRLREESGAFIDASETIVSDPFPPDAPEQFFATALIPVVVLIP